MRTFQIEKGYLVFVLLVLIGLGLFLSRSLPVVSSNQISQTEENGGDSAYLPFVRGSGPGQGESFYPIVFVSRQIPQIGSVYWNVPGGMPGVGVFSRFQVAAPGKLLVLETDGTVRTLIDGSNPTPATFNLIDVNAPDVSYDGTTIVFAGLPAGNYNPEPSKNPGAWRLFTIRADGTHLTQVTFSDQNLDLSQFGTLGQFLAPYDDTDPAWLPDGRIVFSSTRYPSTGQYSAARTSNLHVVNADGSEMHRITSERNGADRPIVDPITGKIVYARWWRNHRFASDSMATIPDPQGGYIQFDGLTTNRYDHVGGPNNLWRNFWQIATINPDGTELAMWSGALFHEASNHAYGGAFTPSGDFIANFFPMYNMTEAAGFGGLRRYQRGAGAYEPLTGITYLTYDYVNPSPPSHGIFNGSYAGEPDVLPDGRIIFSGAAGIEQDYGLYMMNADGSSHQLLYDEPGTTELRAQVIYPRPIPPLIADTITQVANPLPPLGNGPYDTDGTFVFDAQNIYFNAPVDFPIVNAPPVGSADIIRFFIDHQRTYNATFPNRDWPILLAELPVSAAGVVQNALAPANVPLFEQLRTDEGTVPLTTAPHYYVAPGGEILLNVGTVDTSGAGHVAGLNFGRPGDVQECVGCHIGHSMIAVPNNPADALWTNLAPGATVEVSSSRDPQQNTGVIDRRVLMGRITEYWTSAPGQTENQWVKLIFPVPVSVRNVRLYGPRQGGTVNSTLVVHAATVRLFSDAAGTNQVASATVGELAVSGNDVLFADVTARVILVEIDSASGTFNGLNLVGLSEIEVIAMGLPEP